MKFVLLSCLIVTILVFVQGEETTCTCTCPKSSSSDGTKDEKTNPESSPLTELTGSPSTTVPTTKLIPTSTINSSTTTTKAPKKWTNVPLRQARLPGRRRPWIG